MALLNSILWLLFVVAAGNAAAAQSPDEYQVKAAFLFNFAKFVEWPAESFKSPADPIVICIVGNPFETRLENTVNGKRIEERRLTVRQVSGATEVAGCHMLFVAADKKRNGDLLGRAKISPVLTVGETANFAASGGVIGFKTEGGRVRIEINICAAARAHVHISSKLLSLAEIVKEEKK
jgi:hypothetical protein